MEAQASGQVDRWSGGQVGARWRIMITIRIRFRSKELFAQGKLLLGGALVFNKNKKNKKMYIFLTGFGSLFGHFVNKGTQGFIHCSFKVASLATLNKQMLSSLATHDDLSLANHKAQLHLVWVHMVDICTALINSW